MNKSPLRGSAVLHAIFANFRPLFTDAFPTQRAFGAFLAPRVNSKKGLSNPQISRWLDADAPTDATITEILDEHEHAEAVLTACGIQVDVLEAPTLDEVRNIVARHLATKTPEVVNNGNWAVTSNTATEQLGPTSETEERIIAKLLKATSKARKGLVLTTAPFDCGFSFLWHLTAARELVPMHANAVYFLRPTVAREEKKSSRSVVQSFDASISWLAKELGLAHTADAGTIIETLAKKRSMVVFLAVSGRLDGRAEAVAKALYSIEGPARWRQRSYHRLTAMRAPKQLLETLNLSLLTV